jgi:hypothetical protein
VCVLFSYDANEAHRIEANSLLFLVYNSEYYRGAPTWRGCMPPAWLPALSPAGLGESGGTLVTAGRLHAPLAAVWLLLPWASLYDAWDPAPAP